MHNKPIFLVDMDQTCVDMIPVWLHKYHLLSGERITVKELNTKFKSWEFRSFVKHPELLDDVLAQKDFFYDLQPIKGAIENITMLLKKDIDFIFLTQPPRRSAYACEDKRRWILKYIPDFDAKNIIFAHRKELITGSLLFDDNPSHIEEWKKNNPSSLTAAITYLFNKNISVDWRFSKETAWAEFYEKAVKHFNL